MNHEIYGELDPKHVILEKILSSLGGLPWWLLVMVVAMDLEDIGTKSFWETVSLVVLGTACPVKILRIV
jgi:hypothetical protein